MMRLIFLVEGKTERSFVQGVLRQHLADHDVFATCTIVGKSGGGDYGRWRRDLEYLLKGDPSADLRVTTMFDL